MGRFHIYDGFTSTNGVAQGGILSPRCFNVYIDCQTQNIAAPLKDVQSIICLMRMPSPSATASEKLLDIYIYICSASSRKSMIMFVTLRSQCVW